MLLTAFLPALVALGGHQVRHHDASWLGTAKYGVFLDFSVGGPNWQRAIDQVDAAKWASQMKDAGAGYVILTLGVNSGYFCSPNATYESLTGYGPNERCSKRDLPMDLSNALQPYGIKLLLYLPSRAPRNDLQAVQNLSDVNERQPAPQEFTRKWSDVIREWSLRYGKRVSGWWFDGSYNTKGWDDKGRSYSWATWAAAARAGNPDSILAFNPGADPHIAFKRLTDEQDYTAGEENDWKATPTKYPAARGLQWQVLSFLGSAWGHRGEPKLADDEMAQYVKSVNDQGGAVTIDVSVLPKDGVDARQMAQLEAIRQLVRGS